jgi:hypothetical protein
MRSRPIRPNIYLPVVRFGVADSDWFTVLLISCAGYLVPVPFGVTVLYVPLQMWTWLFATAGSIAFFNYVRIGRKPNWLPHKLRAICYSHRQYRALPNGRKRGYKRSWMIEREDTVSHHTEVATTVTTATLLQENLEFQEACEERWNSVLLTMN